MSKKKKIILLVIVLLVLAAAGYFVYLNISVNRARQAAIAEIEQRGLKNMTGVVQLVEGDSLKVLAQVPEEFTPLSKGGYKYIEKEYVLKIASSSIVTLQTDPGAVSELKSLEKIKSGDHFSALASEDIMGKNEVGIAELMIYR